MEKAIRYWVFEFQFSEEKKKALDELTAKYQMTYDEFFNAAITRLIEHPKEFATLGALRELDGEEIKTDSGVSGVRGRNGRGGQKSSYPGGQFCDRKQMKIEEKMTADFRSSAVPQFLKWGRQRIFKGADCSRI